MDKIRNTKNRIVKHRAKITFTTTVTVMSYFGVKMMMEKADQWNEFLEEHNLVDEFYKID